MAEQTTSDITIEADPAAVRDVIADFDAYPTWATGVKHTEVVVAGENGRPTQVRFVIDATPIRDEYVLAYEWHGTDGLDGVSWSLVSARMMKAMDGAYLLDDLGNGHTRVTYKLAVDVAIPMLGMLKRKAEKVIIETALKGLKKRVEATQPDGSS